MKGIIDRESMIEKLTAKYNNDGICYSYPPSSLGEYLATRKRLWAKLDELFSCNVGGNEKTIYVYFKMYEAASERLILPTVNNI